MFYKKNEKIDKDTSVCLTGHRPKSLPWGYNETKESCIKLSTI